MLNSRLQFKQPERISTSHFRTIELNQTPPHNFVLSAKLKRNEVQTIKSPTLFHKILKLKTQNLPEANNLVLNEGISPL